MFSWRRKKVPESQSSAARRTQPADWPDEWKVPEHTPERTWMAFAGGLTGGEKWLTPIRHAQGSFPEFTRVAELERSRVLPTFEHVAVKVFIEAVPGNPMAGEHIFLTDIRVDESTIAGTLNSDSVHRSELTEGQRVTVPIENLSDWFLIRDGRGLGGFTIPLVLKSLSGEQRHQLTTEPPFVWFTHRGGGSAEPDLLAITQCKQCGMRNLINPDDTQEICGICRDGGWRCACSVCTVPLIRYDDMPGKCVWCSSESG